MMSHPSSGACGILQDGGFNLLGTLEDTDEQAQDGCKDSSILSGGQLSDFFYLWRHMPGSLRDANPCGCHFLAVI